MTDEYRNAILARGGGVSAEYTKARDAAANANWECADENAVEAFKAGANWGRAYESPKFNTLLKVMRVDAGFTFSYVSKRLGITVPELSNYEMGRSEMPLEIARAFVNMMLGAE